MSTLDYQLSDVWKQTLAPQKKDEHEPSRERLRSAFVNFRDRAAQLGGETLRDLPFFTVHDVTHLDALWGMVDLIAGESYPLTPTEAFILGGAILVHDLAMSQAAFQGEFEKLKLQPLWRDTVASLLRARHRRPPTRDEISKPDQETEQTAIQSLLRELHARQATVLVTKEWGYAGTKYYLIDDANLRAAFADDIGKIAFSHHWPLEQLRDPTELPQTPAGGPGWLPHEWTVDLVKLACLLRTADAANADDRRAPGFLAALRQPRGVSNHHWCFQTLLRAPHREMKDDRLRYRSNRPFKVDEFDAWWAAHDWLRMVDLELRTVDSFLSDMHRPPLAAKGVWNVDHPNRLAEDLRTEGWEPADAEIRISSIAGLVGMLGGKQLYGNRVDVPLRELIQNAADAIRARRKLLNRDTSFGQIIVRAGRHDPAEEEWIEVEDNGIGMSKSVLIGPLLDFGAAFWGTPRMRRELPGLEASGMEATGQFGIGFFSVFMWGDRVRVTTRRYDRGYDETWVLEFRHGVGLRPLLRKGTVEEQRSLPDGGTRVRVWCEPSRQISNALLLRERHPAHAPTSPESSCTWTELCEWLAPALDVDLYVDDGGSIHQAVKANDWLTIDAQTMVLRLNRKQGEAALHAIRQNQSTWPMMSEPLDIVRDEAGQPIARGTIWIPRNNWFRWSCNVCGGLRSDGGGNFFGIRFAKPETAARHNTIPEQNQTGWIAWAENQLVLDDNRFTPEIRANAAIRLLPLVHPGTLPIGRSHKGWVTLEEFVAEIQHVPVFRCVCADLSIALVVLLNLRDAPTLVVDMHYSLNQLDGKAFAVVRFLREAAAKQWGVPCELSDLNQGHSNLMINGQIVTTQTTTFTRGVNSSSSP